MPLWGLLFSIMICSATLAADYMLDQNRQVATAEMQSVAGNMLVLRRAAMKFAEDHPGAQGQIDPGSLSLPTWYVQDSRVAAYALSGKTLVIYSGNQPGLIHEIRVATQAGVPVGLTSNGGLIDANTGAYVQNIHLPIMIPNGVAAIAQY